jgi:hypothetical protein
MITEKKFYLFIINPCADKYGISSVENEKHQFLLVATSVGARLQQQLQQPLNLSPFNMQATNNKTWK